MATSPVTDSISSFLSEDRARIVQALNLLHASTRRAAKASVNPAVVLAHEAEAAILNNLINRFR